MKTYAPGHALRQCARWSVERLQQYSVKYCVDLCNLQLTSDVYIILISPHIVIRALYCNRSIFTRLVNRRSSRCIIGRADPTGFLDNLTCSWRCSEGMIRCFKGNIGCQAWARTSSAPRLWIHDGSVLKSIIGIRKSGLETKPNWSCLRNIRMSLTHLTVDSVWNSCKPYKYNSHLYGFWNTLCVERPLEL